MSSFLSKTILVVLIGFGVMVSAAEGEVITDAARGVLFALGGGSHRLEIQSVVGVADGMVVASDQHLGMAELPSKENFYQIQVPVRVWANIGCIICATVRSGGGIQSRGTISLSSLAPSNP